MRRQRRIARGRPEADCRHATTPRRVSRSARIARPASGGSRRFPAPAEPGRPASVRVRPSRCQATTAARNWPAAASTPRRCTSRSSRVARWRRRHVADRVPACGGGRALRAPCVPFGHSVRPVAEPVAGPDGSGLADEHEKAGLKVRHVGVVPQHPPANAVDHRAMPAHDLLETPPRRATGRTSPATDVTGTALHRRPQPGN